MLVTGGLRTNDGPDGARLERRVTTSEYEGQRHNTAGHCSHCAPTLTERTVARQDGRVASRKRERLGYHRAVRPRSLFDIGLCLFLVASVGVAGCGDSDDDEPETTLVGTDGSDSTGGGVDACIGAACGDTGPCFGPECDGPVGCGDGVCGADETKASCCTDCGCGSGYECVDNKCEVAASCGNGVCQPGLGENCETCVDCFCPGGKVCLPAQELCCAPDCEGKLCGSDGCGASCGVCSGGKICQSGACTGSIICGDGHCEESNGENCANCPGDCDCDEGAMCLKDGACCKPSCTGKHCGFDGCTGTCGVCAPGAICKAELCEAQASCGNGTCEPSEGENCASCPLDCGCAAAEQCTPEAVCCTASCANKVCGDDGCGGSCGACPTGKGCQAGACTSDLYCGNGQCDPGAAEHCGNCKADCGCVAGASCVGKGCCAPSCAGKACGPDGCGGTCGVCPGDKQCQGGQCLVPDSCGNGSCDLTLGEGCGTCPEDCGCDAGAVCMVDGSCCSPSCEKKTCGSNGCGGECGTCPPGQVCNGASCDGAEYPTMVFTPSAPVAGTKVKVSVLDTSPWVFVNMVGTGPCGPVALSYDGVITPEAGVWQWTYDTEPLTGGSYSFTFSRDNGAVTVLNDGLSVSGPGDCDAICAAAGAACEDHYSESKVCAATGASKAVMCHKYGTCSGPGGGEQCSWGDGSYCEDPCGGGPTGGPPANKFGIGLVGPGSSAQLDAVKELVGTGGHVLLIFPGVGKGTTGPSADWVAGVKGAYDRGLVPVIRIGPGWGQGNIRKDSDDPQHKQYKTLAQAYKKVIAGLPLKTDWPLYVQVHNEPNLCYEWACDGGGSLDGATRAAEYAGFFRDVADALHAIGDPRIKVSLGALAPGGVVSCECCGAGDCGFTPGATGLDFLKQMKAAVPDIWGRLDFLATHSYPASGTGWGFFGPYAESLVGLKYFQQELDTIDKDLPVLVTETGWSTKRPVGGPFPNEDQKADYTKKAYQNVWLPNSKVKGVMPFVFQDAFWGDQEGFGWLHTGGAHLPVFDVIKSYRCALGIGGGC